MKAIGIIISALIILLPGSQIFVFSNGYGTKFIPLYVAIPTIIWAIMSIIASIFWAVDFYEWYKKQLK
jgi:hypothetical protein